MVDPRLEELTAEVEALKNRAGTAVAVAWTSLVLLVVAAIGFSIFAWSLADMPRTVKKFEHDRAATDSLVARLSEAQKALDSKFTSMIEADAKHDSLLAQLRERLFAVKGDLVSERMETQTKDSLIIARVDALFDSVHRAVEITLTSIQHSLSDTLASHRAFLTTSLDDIATRYFQTQASVDAVRTSFSTELHKTRDTGYMLHALNFVLGVVGIATH